MGAGRGSPGHIVKNVLAALARALLLAVIRVLRLLFARRRPAPPPAAVRPAQAEPSHYDRPPRAGVPRRSTSRRPSAYASRRP